MFDIQLGEWKKLLSETVSKLGLLDEPTDVDVDGTYCAISDLDTFHRQLINEYRTTISDKKKAENTAKLFSDFFTQAPIGYVVLNSEGLIEDANRVATEYWAIDRFRMKGLGLYGLISGEHINILSKAIEAAKNSSQRKNVDVKCVRPGGESFWGRFDIIMTQEDSLGEKRLLCSIVDITSDRVLEDAIKKTAVGLSSVTGSDFFRQLTEFLTGYENIDVAVISEVDEQGQFSPISSSPPGSCPKGYKYSNKAELTKINSSVGIYEPNLHHVRELKNALDASDGLSMYLFNANRKIAGHLAVLTNGEFHNKKIYNSILKVVSARSAAELQRFRAEERLKAYRDSLETLVDKRTAELKRNNRKLGQEVEQRKKIEGVLRVAKGQAEEAAKAKSAFLANMSHEVRTPMNGILGIATLMENLELPEKLRNYLGIMRESGNSLLRIINDILDVSTLESGKVSLECREFNLRDLLKGICEVHIQNANAKNIQLFLEYPYQLPELITSDKVRIRQIVENLVSNAIKFTNSGFVIIKVLFPGDMSRLDIRIEDSGIGLSESQTELIFERFSQADFSTTRKYGGTGLGLSICRDIARLFGGEVWCESKEGAGSTFFFSMPIEEQALNPKIRLPKKSSKTLGVNIDSPRLREAVTNVLQSLDIDIEPMGKQEKKKPDKDLRFISDAKRSQDLLNPTLGIINNLDNSVSAVHVDQPYCIESYIEAIGDKQRVAEIKKTKMDQNIFRGYNILLAEDNPINQTIAVDILESMGAQVNVACDGGEALTLYGQQPFDLVFMDCLMPNMDGFEALAEIRKLTPPQPPIVALTANAMKGDREKCLDAGFDEYIAKPIQLEDLKRVWTCTRNRAARPVAPREQH